MDYPNKNRRIAFAFFASFFSLSLQAQTSTEKHLALNEALSLGIENSKELKISGAKYTQAKAAVQEARLRQYPDVKVSGSYMRLNNPTIDLKIPLGSSSGQSGSEGSPASQIEVHQAAYALANASLPLFAGFKIRSGIESAKYLEKAATLDLEHDNEEVLQNITNAYYNLYKAQAAVKLVNENLKQAQQRAKDFSNLEQNGLLARNDLLKAQLQVSNVELALLDAENNMQIANYNMDLLLGLPENTLLQIDEPNVPTATIKTPADWETTALENRADLKALNNRYSASKAGVTAAKGDYYPSLALTGGYIAAHVPDVVTITNALNGGVGLSYNIASLYKTGAKVKEAKAAQEQVYWATGQLTDGIKLQTNIAYQNYNETVKKITVYKKAVEQATENYRITKNKYDNSLASTTDLLDADVAKLQADINYEYALADASTAYSKLLQTAGILKINK